MLERIEKIATILSLLAVPIIVVVIGTNFQEKQGREALDFEYVQLALSIVKEKDKVDPFLNEWAVDILKLRSPVEMKEELVTALKQGESSFTATTDSEQWFTVVGSLETKEEAEQLAHYLYSIQPDSFSEEVLFIYKTKISGLYALTLGQGKTKSAAILSSKNVRTRGWVADSFAQVNKDWVLIQKI